MFCFRLWLHIHSLFDGTVNMSEPQLFANSIYLLLVMCNESTITIDYSVDMKP